MRPRWSLRDLFNFLSSFDRFLSPFFNQPSHHLSPPQFLSQNLLWRLCIFLVSFNLGQVNLVVTLKCTYLFTSSQSVCLLGPTFILVLAGRPHKRNCTFWYRRIWGSPTANFFWDCPAIWNVIAKSSVCKMFDIARLHPISLRSARKKQQFPLFPLWHSCFSVDEPYTNWKLGYLSSWLYTLPW